MNRISLKCFSERLGTTIARHYEDKLLDGKHYTVCQNRRKSYRAYGSQPICYLIFIMELSKSYTGSVYLYCNRYDFLNFRILNNFRCFNGQTEPIQIRGLLHRPSDSVLFYLPMSIYVDNRPT